MKPINLKIKGLNSFIDSQEINFEKLTEKGFFGIFGPTGSGKSTILDGITLALYGEVARKSSNFMNTNCDSLNVSYEFQMSEKEIKRYRVDREFKRDNKTGSIKSKSAKVIDVTDGNDLILEEGVRTATGKCEEIIGLKLEDFARTVVLPQGKFSEFLKLEGKERRNMLERLFNLQKYGDDLSFKLWSKIKVEKQKSNILEGELKGFEDISEEILKKKTQDLSEQKEQYEKCLTELKNAESEFSKGKELWDLQNELKDQEDGKRQLKKNEEEINESQKKVTSGESALKVKSYIDSFESSFNQIEIVKNELNNLEKQAEIIKIEKEKTEAALQTVKYKKDNEIPLLKIKEQKVIDAIEENAVLKVLIKEKIALLDDIKELEEKLLDINKKTETNSSDIKIISDNIRDKDLRADSLKVQEEYKKKVNEGIVVLNTYESLISQKNNLTKEINITLSNIEKVKSNSDILSKQLNQKESLLIGDEEALKKLIETCPGDQNTLLSLQQKQSYVKVKWDKYNEYNVALKSSKVFFETLKKDLIIKEQTKIKLEDEIEEIRDNIKKAETENIAHVLRVSLSEGKACPVCGSKEHHIENVESIDLSNSEELKAALKSKEDKFKKIMVGINKDQANIETEAKNIEDNERKINELGEDFKAYSAENLQNELDKLKADINNYNSENIKLNNKIKGLTEEKNNFIVKYNNENIKLIHNSELLNKLNEELRIKETEFGITDNELSALKAELAIEDFKSKSDEIFKKEKEKAVLEKEIKILRQNHMKAQEVKELLNREAGVSNEELREKKAIVYEKNKNIIEKEYGIKSKVGDVENLEGLKKEITQAVKNIVDEYTTAEKNKEKTDNQYNECNNKKISAQGNLISLNERINKDKDALQNALTEEGFKDVYEAKSKFISKYEIDKLKSHIEEYKSDITRLSVTIDSLKNKINGRSLTDMQWLEIQNMKSEITEKLKQLTECSINLDTEVKTIIEKLIKKNELLKKKEELDHKLSLLSELESLFKGKKFVEFVATNQLKYVSIEACKKLKEITGGNYGLEVDENGKFLIRDYKNGGSQRDASTLSGGETFVASLALALALSAQIQLKGTAPLELFFLDEGFGTLDDNLLEVVMDSLEKIHNNKLSIGIISHVESIKNRVPVKLIITAAEAGMGGSKVKIERS